MKKSKAQEWLKTSLQTLSNIDETPFDEKHSYFKGNLPASKALRIILFKFYVNILHYREKLLENHDSEDLHQLRVNIRKSRAFIKTFHFLFEKELDALLLTQLSKAASYTNKKRDLDVIKAQLDKSLESESSLYSDITKKIDKEQNKIDVMLESDALEDFLIYYEEVLLEGDHLFIKHKEDIKIKNCAKQSILDLHEGIQKRITKLEKKFSVEKLHKIRIAFKKLRYLLEEFQHIYDAEHIAADIKHMKELQTLLGDFNDTINQKKLIAEYFDKPEVKEDASQHALVKMTSEKEETLIKDALAALHDYKSKTLAF